MGVYLSSPVTDKDSIDQKCDNFIYGASSMQGWRITQEDAHNCIPNFHAATNTSFFAVYDGHGGSEVAKYCEKHFPDFVKTLMAEQDGFSDNIKQFIQLAFLTFDATLTDEDVIKELKELAGKDDDVEDEEEGDPVGRTETDMLKEEANMPLDQLLAQYKSKDENKDFKSPFLIAQRKTLKGSKKDDENGDASSISVSSSSSAAKDQDSDTLLNGVDNENNSSSCADLEILDNETNSDKQKDSVIENNNEKSPADLDSQTDKEVTCSSSSTGGSSCITSGSSSISGSSSAEAALPNEEQPSGSGLSSPGIRKSKAKAAAEMAKLDGDVNSSDEEDDDEEDEDMWEDMSDDDDEDDDEDGDQDEDVPMMDVSNEEPGSDSGCTACVCLLQGKQLIVANAGDSRCVLSRAGKAIELSFDHKPEDECEKTRIERAGGKVTSDGRVNGGLNLSRAIGDHVYKRNKDLPAKEQMITSLPDVEIAELCPEDQFFVVACDGIWNYMSSQEVVDYVLEKLKDPEKRQKPSLICEELFDHCLAPNTFGDGTGCDNMTCIIVVLDSFQPATSEQVSTQASENVPHNVEEDRDVPLKGSDSADKTEQDATGSIKRCSDNVEANEGRDI
nr:protein phosphatase 1G-like [Biomphalaria glabrata]